MNTKRTGRVVSAALSLLVLGAAARGAAAGPEAPPTLLVGLLTKQAQKQCVAVTHEVRWVNPWWEVGFTRVAPRDDLDLAPFEGRPVVVEGRVEVLPPLPPMPDATECGMMQARSDWVEGPGGTRLRRDAGPGLPGFRAAAVRPFDGLAVRLVLGELEVRVTNPFAAPLAPLAVTLHYEGCYGKPGATERRTEFPALAPGESVTARFPLLDTVGDRPAGRTVHRAWSVQLSAPPGPAVFALDVSLHRFPGVVVECPER